VGDPPLFLGYLQGVPFWWVTAQCWKMWLTGVGLLLLAFYLVDSWNFRRAPREVRARETAHDEWHFSGLGNLFFLGVVLSAVMVSRPLFLREALMIAAAAGSYFTTGRAVHERNDFNFAPLKEVAILFAGIFATMMPALDWLQTNTAQLGQPSPGMFFWGSGALSSVLDNAPTYLSFLSAAFGVFVSPDAAAAVAAYVKAHGADLGALTGMPHSDEICHAIAILQAHFPEALRSRQVTAEQARMALFLANPLHSKCLQAISVGSVFFGANTYIGNGPNFMVKAIADQQKAHSPTFLGYLLRFTLPYMLPVLVIVWWAFFRH
jgi:Na+/H+ antiporter NhaD/arsenite permease-like protein